MKKIDVSKGKKLLDEYKKIEYEQKYHKLGFYEPYPKQLEFHELGASKIERGFFAGTQLGKTEAGAAEMAMHLTGEYPAWWKGRRFDKPVQVWVTGKTSSMVRDFPQAKLFGKPGVVAEKGTGYVPKESIIDVSLSHGVTDGYDTVQVRHKTNGVEDGISTVGFKSYDSGRENLQGATLDIVWMDEEPKEDIYFELLARVTATGGFVFFTFTPLLGRSKVVIRYLDGKSPDRGYVRMTLDEVPMTAERRRQLLDGMSESEKEARAYGLPRRGSGVIFEMSWKDVSEPTMENIPYYWAKIWGIDFGIGHPFAAALLLWDKDNDVVHVHHTVRMAGGLPINHAAAMKPIGADVPVAWPQDGVAREKSSAQPLADFYKKEGLRMLPEHATWPEGGYSTEAGIVAMQKREKDGKLKYAFHLSELQEERSNYHRKDGLIVKEYDDILSAVRVGIMALRFAKPVVLGSKRPPRESNSVSRGVDFDLF